MKKKKGSRSYYKAKADKLWSQVIMKRNKGRCEVCGRKAKLSPSGKKIGLDPHHIIGRKNLTLRHDIRNGVLLCFQCHTGNKTSVHQDPIWFLKWMELNRPKDLLYLRFHKMELTTQVDYEERIEELTKELEKVRG